MIKALRKRHRQVWTLWAVLIPAGILFAWLVIPNTVPVKLLGNTEPALLPVVVRTASSANYQVNLRSNTEKKSWQLEWKNKAALTVPSAVIYRVTTPGQSITSQPLVGRIEAMGDYVFALPADSSGYPRLQLVLYDFIHEQKIDSIKL